MTLGAMIVFRTADRFGRAGEPPERTLEALYRGVQRHVEFLPDSLQDPTDRTVISVLLADALCDITGEFAAAAFN